MPRKMTNEEHHAKLMIELRVYDLKYETYVNYRTLRGLFAGSRDAMKSAVKINGAKTYSDILKVLEKVKQYGNAVTLDKLLYCYGPEEGQTRFDNYRDKQAYTASTDYFLNKGMSSEEVSDYHKSRAVTLDNMIKRYGEIEGAIRFQKYRERQAFTNSSEYLGYEKYKLVNSMRGHNLKNYVRLYGQDAAESKLIEFWKGAGYRSKMADDFFASLSETVMFKGYKCYFGENEYVLYSRADKRVYKYDFVCYDMKICIEFHGDHYHGNPDIYKPSDTLKGRGQSKIRAIDAWSSDAKKRNALLSERNIETLEIWESDAKRDIADCFRRIDEYIKLHRRF